jgi:mannose-6-phosphate isomerase-like protein (cupin superfamily)
MASRPQGQEVPMEARHSDTANRVLEVFGETVIIRRDPAGQPIDAAVVEEIVPPGVGAPLHRHSREDEICYVIEGTFRIWRGEEVLDVRAGGVALLPRDQIHSFQNVGEATGRLLTVIVPAGFERFFEAIADRSLAEGEDDRIAAVAGEFGLEILGPTPA